MRTIYKYPMIGAVHGEFTIRLPVDARFLHAGLDPTGKPCMWCMVDTENEPQDCPFRIAFTGENYGKEYDTYLATYICGSLVCHLFRCSQ